MNDRLTGRLVRALGGELQCPIWEGEEKEKSKREKGDNKTPVSRSERKKDRPISAVASEREEKREKGEKRPKKKAPGWDPKKRKAGNKKNSFDAYSGKGNEEIQSPCNKWEKREEIIFLKKGPLLADRGQGRNSMVRPTILRKEKKKSHPGGT